MLAPPFFTTTQPRLIAFVAIQVPPDRIRGVLRPALGELRSTLCAQGLVVTGAWFSHHLRLDRGWFDFRVGFPVDRPVQAAGRVQRGELPATRVARTDYQGGYHALSQAWGEFEAWIAATGHVPANDRWEYYLVGPESGPDTRVWRTQLDRPVCR